MRHTALAALFVCSFVALAAEDGAVKKDVEKMQGKWSLVSLEQDGNAAPEEDVKKFKLEITGMKWRLEGGDVQEGTMKIDPSKKPKHMESTNTTANVSYECIYELEKDTLKMCVALPGTDRPKEFKSGNGVMLFVFKRDK